MQLLLTRPGWTSSGLSKVAPRCRRGRGRARPASSGPSNQGKGSSGCLRGTTWGGMWLGRSFQWEEEAQVASLIDGPFCWTKTQRWMGPLDRLDRRTATPRPRHAPLLLTRRFFLLTSSSGCDCWALASPCAAGMWLPAECQIVSTLMHPSLPSRHARLTNGAAERTLTCCCWRRRPDDRGLIYSTQQASFRVYAWHIDHSNQGPGF